LVPDLAKLSYEERLIRIDLPTLAYRRTRGDAIETYKYLHGKYSVDSESLLLMHDSTGPGTRGNGLNRARNKRQ